MMTRPINTHHVLWRIRRSVLSQEESLTAQQAEALAREALARVRQWMGGGTKTEIYALELMIERIQHGDSMWMLGTLADAFLCYLQNGQTAREPLPDEGEPTP